MGFICSAFCLICIPAFWLSVGINFVFSGRVYAVASSMIPWFMSYSPSDLLDRHLDVSCRLHAAQSQSLAVQSSAPSTQTSSSVSQPASSSPVEVLHHELSMLNAQLMFERQRREVHACRGRRLLARVNHLNSLAEQNEAMVRDVGLLYNLCGELMKNNAR